MLLDAHTHKREAPVGRLRVYNLSREEWSAPTALSPFSAGIHPKDIDAASLDAELAALESSLKRGAVALGEAGLDRLVKAPLPLQERAFEAQAALSERLGLPLVVHCVRAFPELLSLRKRLKPNAPWIVHGFRGSPESAKELLRHGLLLSFGAALLRPTPSLKEAFQATPLDKLLLESDEAPESIEEIRQAAASLHGVETEKLDASLLALFEALRWR